jgi:hypothetical protein
MLKNTLYIVAYTIEDCGLTIETFTSSFYTVAAMADLMESFTDYQTPDRTDSPRDLLNDFNQWVTEKNDNESDLVIALETINI